jgi:hypothetical protein
MKKFDNVEDNGEKIKNLLNEYNSLPIKPFKNKRKKNNKKSKKMGKAMLSEKVHDQEFKEEDIEKDFLPLSPKQVNTKEQEEESIEIKENNSDSKSIKFPLSSFNNDNQISDFAPISISGLNEKSPPNISSVIDKLINPTVSLPPGINNLRKYSFLPGLNKIFEKNNQTDPFQTKSNLVLNNSFCSPLSSLSSSPISINNSLNTNDDESTPSSFYVRRVDNPSYVRCTLCEVDICGDLSLREHNAGKVYKCMLCFCFFDKFLFIETFYCSS